MMIIIIASVHYKKSAITYALHNTYSKGGGESATHYTDYKDIITHSNNYVIFSHRERWCITCYNITQNLAVGGLAMSCFRLSPEALLARRSLLSRLKAYEEQSQTIGVKGGSYVNPCMSLNILSTLSGRFRWSLIRVLVFNCKMLNRNGILHIRAIRNFICVYKYFISKKIDIDDREYMCILKYHV